MSELALRLIAENKKTKATSLDLGNCGLTELPEELFECIWLKKLVLAGEWWEWDEKYNEWIQFISPRAGKQNQLSRLDGLEKLKNLNTLVFSSNKIRDIHPLAALNALSSLNCSSNQIRDLQPLANLVKLTTLNCSSNQIQDIQPLANLLSFTVLNCYNNQIQDIYPLVQLGKIIAVNCSVNQIQDLRPIANLSEIKLLLISSNQIQDLEPLASLKSLAVLHCSDNLIEDIRPLARLDQLNSLYCSSNQIQDIRPLAGLYNLTSLDCSFNQIQDLSPILKLIEKGIPVRWRNLVEDINRFQKLLDRKDYWLTSKILASNNPLISPPPEIVQQGNESIINYFRELGHLPVTHIREVKLLILGEGGAGKTSLARKLLQGHKAPLPLESESTHGIEINSLPFEDKAGETYTAHLWDFGGQEIYHATHQFFLTKRSVYILVTDARKEDTDFNYWLHIVELLSDNSPVFIVQNRKGGRQRDINLSGLQGRFSNIRGHFSIDLKLENPGDCLEMDRLREAIELEIRHLPHLNEEIPVVWAEVRRELEELKKEKHFISDQDYLRIAEKQGLNEERAQFLGRFLHDLGVFLYFQSDPILKRWLFLNNEWATDGVYAILDDQLIRDERKGRFTRTEASGIWQQHESYKGMRDELLQLMMRFELCYRIPELEPETFIAPQLLTAEEPKAGLQWNNANNLQLRYQYEFMPKGLLSRFIVRLHRYIRDAEKEAWKTGVILHREAASAKVVETYGVRHLHVRANGKRAKELVTVIAEEIDRLNDGYHNLRVQKLVPCNCSVCRKRSQEGKESEPPNFYEYQDLLTRQERGKTTVECKYSYQDVNVLHLIDDVFVTTLFSPKVKKIFISYSKSDKAYLENLQKQLNPLVRQELVEVWDDTHLVPGANWDQSIRQELLTADIILLLVSADLMATDYIWDIEMSAALERHARGEAVVIPVIIRPCMWQDAPFARLTALPAKGKPVSKWKQEDEAWQQVVEKIAEVVRRAD